MAISKDKKKIDSLLSRRVVEAIVEGSLRKRLMSGKKLRIKLGFDPTAPDIHLGHTVSLKKLKEFQDLGHQIVFLIGDYTTMVGDPSGKTKTRPTLTEEQIKENAKTYLAQVGKVLDIKKVELRRNSEWFKKMSFSEVIALTSKFTVARMIERDDFEKRLREGVDIHMHELLYPMMQAYDSVMLKADVEIGGTDQRFNILAGRELQKKMGETPQDVLLLGPILVGTDGTQKMSKSLDNYVGVTDTPEDMFGKLMSIPDTALWEYFTLTTEVPEKEIARMESACAKGELNPRDAKVRLAKEVITMYHSKKAADEAEGHFNTVFRKKDVPDDVPEFSVKAGKHGLADLLLEAGMVKSKSEARRVIVQKGVKTDGEVVTDESAAVEVDKKGILIQKGKRHFVRIKSK